MYIENDTIHFKSDEPYYTKEKSGIKNNTVRFISDEEHDIILDTIDNLKYISIFSCIKKDAIRGLFVDNFKYIPIQKIIGKKDCFIKDRFIRELTDISIIKKNIDDYRLEYYLIYIFSWT
jgi:hypothetical protein